MRIRWFFAFFFISGFCSLVYEVVWLRLSMAKFGVTTPMVSIVLSVFMAGLGIGSLAGGAFIRRFERAGAAIPLRLYGLVELLIGVSGLLAPLMINAGYQLLRDSGRGLAWGSSFYYVASGGWMALALLPWCTCMGATFPFAMAAIRAIHGEESKHSFSFLYLANVFGAILGTLVPAFVLIELFGFHGTLRIASAFNFLLAGVVFLLSLRVPALPSAEQPELWRAFANDAGRGVLWMLFATGLCSMAMEVVWTRQFTVYLGNLVYAFAVILAIYLLATFLGSYVYRRRARLHPAAGGSAAWIPLGLLSLLPLLSADPRLPIPELTYTVTGFVYGAIRAAFGIALFSGFVGFLTPMLVDRWSAGDPDRAGRAYAVNVLGSILGPLLSGFAILPFVSERWALWLIALPLFAIGLVVAFRSQRAAGQKLVFGAAAALSILLAIGTRDYGYRFPHREELRDYTATVIATGEGMNKRLLVNGTGMTALTPITKIMTHLPLTLLGRQPENGLVICFGMGTSFRSMLSWDIPTTAVELVPSVPKLIGYYHADGPELLRSPLAQVVIDDGRRFLERSPAQYDVIVVDPPPPVSAPASSLLYSREFYAAIKPHLRSDAILQMWFPGGDDATLASVAKSLRDSFPYVHAYESIEGWGVHFLASREPLNMVTGDVLAQRLPVRAAKDLVEWNADSTPASMLNDTLSGEKSLDGLIAPDRDIPAMSDDRPVNEYFLLRSLK